MAFAKNTHPVQTTTLCTLYSSPPQVMTRSEYLPDSHALQTVSIDIHVPQVVSDGGYVIYALSLSTGSFEEEGVSAIVLA
jgi:hypothetical protein